MTAAKIAVSWISPEPNQSFLLPLVEREFEQADADADGEQADEIHGVAALGARDQFGWVFDHAVREIQRDQADGQVDEKDPMPVVVISDPAAKRRTDRRCDDDRDAVQSKGLPAFLDRKSVGKDGLFAGRQATTAQPLQNSRTDQQRQRRCQAAE